MAQWIDLAERRAGRRLANLLEAEALLIGALRIWVAAFRQRRCGLPELRWLFNRHALPGAGMVLHHLLLQIATGAYRTLDVGYPCCPTVRVDEERLLALVATLQRGQTVAAEVHLGSWMPPESLDQSLGAAEALALMMKTEGFDLPQRPTFGLDLEKRHNAEVVAIHRRRCKALSVG